MKNTVFTDASRSGLANFKAEQRQATQSIPTPNELQSRKLARLHGYSLHRLTCYLFSNQGASTAHISTDCAIGNVPDVVMKGRQQLADLGLSIDCRMKATVNRYGEKVRVGTWWLSIEDHAEWFGAESANDCEVVA